MEGEVIRYVVGTAAWIVVGLLCCGGFGLTVRDVIREIRRRHEEEASRG